MQPAFRTVSNSLRTAMHRAKAGIEQWVDTVLLPHPELSKLYLTMYYQTSAIVRDSFVIARCVY